MEQGWIYVLVNSTIPGLSKVGRTTRLPAHRAAELSAATGVATPFVLVFEQEFSDCFQAEQAIHAELDSRGLRVATNREFFRGSTAEIIHVIMQTATSTTSMPIKLHAPSRVDLLTEGDRHLFGEGETLQDVAEALRCYRQAAMRGSLVAFERLGVVYAFTKNSGRVGRNTTFRYLKEGARRGNYYCYCEMAAVFAAETHTSNFVKAWDLFFSLRSAKHCPEVEVDPARYILALRRYIASSLDLGLAPGYIPELNAQSDAIIQSLLLALEGTEGASDSHMRIAGILRWSCSTLLRPGRTATPSASPICRLLDSIRAFPDVKRPVLTGTRKTPWTRVMSAGH